MRQQRPFARQASRTTWARASARFTRRRQAWLVATKGVAEFEAAIAHPAFRLVEEANDLLLRLGDG